MRRKITKFEEFLPKSLPIIIIHRIYYFQFEGNSKPGFYFQAILSAICVADRSDLAKSEFGTAHRNYVH